LNKGEPSSKAKHIYIS